MRKGIISVLVFLLLPISYFLYIAEQGNFHAITEGEAYRSAQLGADSLKHYIREYGIRSVLNLRGPNAGSSWYRDEIQVSGEYNVKHYDINLSASRELTPEQLHRLMEIFRDAPRPILIHCKSGSDRTGLVAAMWKVVIDGESKAEAKKQLSIMFGHLPVGETTAMDLFFERWSP